MSSNLVKSTDFFKAVLRSRLSALAGQGNVPMPPLPVLQDDKTPFARFVIQRRLSSVEFLALMTGLVPHLQPFLIDNAVQEFFPQGGDIPELGGVKGSNHRGMLPTGETVFFLLGHSYDIAQRLTTQRIFSNAHFFSKERILYVEEAKPGEPTVSGRLILDPEYVSQFTLGQALTPRMSASFPAQLLQTSMEWSDLILSTQTRAQLAEVETWIRHNDTLLYDWQMEHKIKPGFRALFYGPPGTGKTMAATLLGKQTGHEVFRIDLSSLVSKYIGETEKNLSMLFERAENKKWILFFDEADALFGKRTNVRDAHDRFANQEVSYLLQRIEDFNGLSILASNFKSNMDDAFTRRFQSIVYFSMPKAPERLTIWRNTLPPRAKLADNVNLTQLAEKYELTGANILNIVHYCCLQVLGRGADTLTQEDLVQGIHRELTKENKVI
jgi:ATPase family associated with various cellular activities (AAA)